MSGMYTPPKPIDEMDADEFDAWLASNGGMPTRPPVDETYAFTSRLAWKDELAKKPVKLAKGFEELKDVAAELHEQRVPEWLQGLNADARDNTLWMYGVPAMPSPSMLDFGRPREIFVPFSHEPLFHLGPMAAAAVYSWQERRTWLTDLRSHRDEDRRGYYIEAREWAIRRPDFHARVRVDFTITPAFGPLTVRDPCAEAREELRWKLIRHFGPSRGLHLELSQMPCDRGLILALDAWVDDRHSTFPPATFDDPRHPTWRP